ncbi:hypothetical protein ASG17_14565 [Brevundimonas sp. Leaf363]|uniref:hypothetical protein n=1 Tax=Brevundimonas sp. Leaf363 TaxID=1736353 RepID=UPI0006F81CB2|nr:hypothetical protein [Brevundimonas sp. Leaf363]KQS53733.1 hypothetical protein ASG17_14565 [Brevundimonas sp. Leaf363]
MIASLLCLALFGASPPTGTAAVEAALEQRSARFEARLDQVVAAIEADLDRPGPAEQRRRIALARIEALRPDIAAYAADARAAFDALAAEESGVRASELREYGGALVRYAEGLPADLATQVDRELAVRP